MRKSILFILLLLSIPAFTSAMSGNPAIDQQYLFEYSHINHAWGFQMSGMYIDRNGSVYTFDHSHAPWRPSEDNVLTEEDLQEKYAQKNKFVKSIDPSVLNEMLKLISPASEAEITEPGKKCFDSGSGAYTAYTFDSTSGNYHPVLLYQVGDRPKKNLSDEAKILYEWLFTVFGNRPTMCTP
jgi:hypothetical protein